MRASRRVRGRWRAYRWLGPAAVLSAGALIDDVAAQPSPARTVAPICVGTCPRVVGLRVNWRDREVHRIDGINATVWTPYVESQGKTNGLALGLPILASGSVDGFVVALLAAQSTDRVRGIGIAGIALGADRLTGVLASGLVTLTGESRGLALSAGASIATLRLEGVAAGGVGVFAGGGWGVAAGGLAAHAGGGFRGVIASGLGVFSGRMTGVALTGGLHRAGEFRGASVALVNYARSLRGLQLGAINIVADGRSPRFLPLVNWR